MLQNLSDILDSSLLALFTDAEILRFVKLRYQRNHDGKYSEDTIEYKRLLFLEYLYQGGFIGE